MDRFQRLHPAHFDGDPSKDAHDFLDRFHYMFLNLNFIESNRVDFLHLVERGYKEMVADLCVGQDNRFIFSFIDPFLARVC